MATAPTVGDDLCNKTYVDAAAGGGSPIGFRVWPTSQSIVSGYVIWTGVDFNSGIYNTTTGIWTIADAGTYLMSVSILTYIVVSSGLYTGYINSTLMRTRGGVLTTELRLLNSYNTGSGSVSKYFHSTTLCLIECLAGDTFQFYLDGNSTFKAGILLSGSSNIDTQINFIKVA